MFIIKWFLEYHKIYMYIWRINANIVQKYCIKGMVKVATINTKRYFTHWNSICRVMTYHLDRHERYTWKEKRCLEVTSKIFFYFCEVSNITYSITNCLEKTKYHLKNKFVWETSYGMDKYLMLSSQAVQRNMFIR